MEWWPSVLFWFKIGYFNDFLEKISVWLIWPVIKVPAGININNALTLIVEMYRLDGDSGIIMANTPRIKVYKANQPEIKTLLCLLMNKSGCVCKREIWTGLAKFKSASSIRIKKQKIFLFHLIGAPESAHFKRHLILGYCDLISK